MDVEALKSSFAQVADSGDEVPLYFYSYLFLGNPQLRRMFPPSMAAQRDRLVAALGQIVTDVDRSEALLPFLENLGRDHRKFEVVADHYEAVGEALLATLQHFLGPAWTPHLAASWQEAYAIVADVMIKAADADSGRPPWWDAEVVAHERRGPDLAVITVRPDEPVPYVPGQSVSVETTQRPRLWRYYSPANAPRPDRTLELHVRAVDGGWVSSSLVMTCGIGDEVRLGPPVGELRLIEGSDRPLLMLAGGTGLAPLRAMVEALAASGERRRTHLYVEGRSETDLYDLATLGALERAHPWLTVIPVVQRGSSSRFHVGTAVDLAVRQGGWAEHEVYVCGGDEMVARTRDVLAHVGIEGERVCFETFSYRTGPASMGAGMEAPDDLDPPLRRDATAGRALGGDGSAGGTGSGVTIGEIAASAG